MLEELHIRDVALIEDAWIAFEPGFTVLTGETGAGKTALLSALKLIMGERVDLGVIRHEACNALVEAQFSDDVVVSRRIERSGRHKAQLNGELVNAQTLAREIGPLIDLHGQHEHQELLRVSAHRDILDAWAQPDLHSTLADYQGCFERYRAAADAYEEVVRSLQTASDEVQSAQLVIAEIDRVAPVLGEDDDIRSQLPLLEHAEELSSRLQNASRWLGSEGGALDAVAQASVELQKIAHHNECIQDLLDSIDSAHVVLDEALRDLKELDADLVFDPEQLEQSLARLAELEGLIKRFGPTLSVVLERREQLEKLVVLTHDSTEVLASSKLELEHAEQALRNSNQLLGNMRRERAREFSARVSEAMQQLEMSGCSFVVSVEDLEFAQWGTQGGQQVEFLFSPSPKIPPRPLVKIASGGEVSRVMLAIKSILGGADSVPTLVFDEIDSGIGGATALAVGARLAELAITHQVIVVTHLAQVASYAQYHYVVRKVDAHGEPATIVVPVEGDNRVSEIARMLSGEVTEKSTAHANELLAAVNPAGK